ncbi:hypothetical protein PG984_003185 [Apiospora sp. TS-2023a]
MHEYPPPSSPGKAARPASNILNAATVPPGKGWLNPLHSAASRGHTSIVRMLLQHYCLVHSEQQNGSSVNNNDACDARDSDGLTPLAHAIAGGHGDTVTLLLSHGAQLADVDGCGHGALHWAVLQRREECLRTLLEHVDAVAAAGEGEGTEEESLEKSSVYEVVDAAGRTPLHLAAETGFEAAVALLLQYGADPSARAFKVP